MFFFIVSGNNLPETTNVLMGNFVAFSGEERQISLNLDNADPDQKKIYDDFFNLVGNLTSVQIINSPYQIDMNRVAPINIEQEAMELDYLLMNPSDKKIVDDAVILLNSFPEIE
jgi:hypothetical protein